jgi:hypothetical protein
LSRAHSECVALAFAARALECTLVTKEAWVTGALTGLLWASTTTHEPARLQEEGGVSVELGLAGTVLVGHIGVAFALIIH